MGHGGTRAGAGRPKGAKGKKTVELEARSREAATAIEAAIGCAFEGDAHAYLMSVYKDPCQPADLRLEAAKAAVRYEKPALASIDMTADATVHVISPVPLTPEEREAADAAWLEKHSIKVH